MNSNILTYLRVKETNHKLRTSGNKIVLGNKTYGADHILFGKNQDNIYQHITKSILSKCVQGYNCSVFAYGQTGSGKTYTIQGDYMNPGLIPRSLDFLHNIYDEVLLSFIEIYNESMIDLFEPSNSINIREDPSEGVLVDSLTLFRSKSLTESLEFYKRGIMNRKTANTHMNDSSSRSHCIFTVQLETKNKNIIKRSKLCFVDLAGSERIEDNEIERFKETVNINKSLLCLGRIVQKLGSNDKSHISYRDSKLTFLLKDSLGGNSKLAIIGTINVDFVSDSINTMNFLSRSKLISNCPSINYDATKSTVDELVENLRVLDEENALLKSELSLFKSENNGQTKSSLMYDVKMLKREVLDVKDELDNVSNLFKSLIDVYFENTKNYYIGLDDRIKEINSFRKENISNLLIKKRKTDQD